MIFKTKSKIVLDVHGDEVSTRNYTFYSSKLSKEGQYYKKALENSGLLSLLAQPFYKSFIKNLIRNKKIVLPKGACTGRTFLESKGFDAMTIEFSAHVSTPESCEEAGRIFVKSISAM